jgi:hypothetical protein
MRPQQDLEKEVIGLVGSSRTGCTWMKPWVEPRTKNISRHFQEHKGHYQIVGIPLQVSQEVMSADQLEKSGELLGLK